MRFLIENNKPYLVSGGRVYPVEITENGVRADLENGDLSDRTGPYCLQEVIAKLGVKSSSIAKRRKKQEV